MQEFHTKELTDFAGQLLTELLDPEKESGHIEEQLERLEEYTRKFESWRQALPLPLEEAMQWPNGEQESLRVLSSKHEKLLELAAALREDTLQRRQVLSKKGQGLLAYVDRLPKSLSIFRGKKG